jgi:hypothetical protein
MSHGPLRATGTVRVDPATGSREEFAYHAVGRHLVFGITYRPRTPPRAGVVICSPLYSEAMAIYRREVLLARALAARGVAVQRFHYAGTGHSAGSFARMSFAGLRRDATAAARLLGERTGVNRVLMLGTRFGALVAAATARALETAPVVLWEPTLNGEGYFRGLLRLRRIHELRLGEATGRPEASLAELSRGGTLEVLGWPVHGRMVASAARQDLAALLGPQPRRVALFQLSQSAALRSEYVDFLRAGRAAGLDVQVVAIPERPVWWFTDATWRPDEARAEAAALVRATTTMVLSWAEEGGERD